MRLPFLFLILMTAMGLQTQAEEVDPKVLIWVQSNELDTRPADQVFTAEDLKIKSNKSLGEILSEVSGGFSPQTSSAGQFQSYSLQGSKSEHVLVLLDGVPLNDLSSPSVGFDYSLIDVAQLERIEVFKGSHAVRYGSQAFAGVVLLISKKPASLYGGSGLLGGSTEKTVRAQVAGWGSLSSETRILGSLTHNQGYSGSAAKEADGNHEVDGYQKWSGLLGVVSETFESSWRFLQFQTQDYRDYDYGAGPGGDDPNAKSSSRMSVTAASYEKIIADKKSFQARAYNQNFLRFENDAADALHTSFLQSKYQSDVSGIEFIYSYDNYLMGVNFEYQDLDTNSVGSFSQEIRKDSKSKTSLFFIPVFVFSSNLSLSPGLRLECGKDHCWAQKEVVVISSDFTLRVAESFRAPSFYQLYSGYGVPTLKEEKVRHFSLAYQKNLKIFQVSAIAHKNLYSELIDYDSVTSKFINRGKVNTQGIDLSFERKEEIFRWPWRNRLNFSYLEAKDLSTGMAMPRRPRLVANLQALVDISTRWQIGPSLRYRSRIEDVDGLGGRVFLKEATTLALSGKYAVSPQGEMRFSFSNLTNNQTGDFWGYEPEQPSFGIDFVMNF